MASLRLTPGGDLAVVTPFHRGFVDDLKATVPYSQRRWDPTAKVWLVADMAAPLVAKLIEQHFGEQVVIPTAAGPAAPVTKLVQLMYLGRCKERSPGLWTASGYADASWSLSFPETVLRAYFNDELSTPQQPTVASSLYATLGLKAFADADTIKTAYRRMAKLWHPDVNREADATARFQAINHAWSVLKDDRTRRKYDVGLTLELRASQPAIQDARHPGDYRAPLTCGLLMVEGIEQLGVLVVSKIHGWHDITNDKNQTMVSSWSMDLNNFETRWV